MKENNMNRLATFIVFLIISAGMHAADPDSTLLNISFGKQEAELSTSSVSEVKGDDLRKSHVATLSNTFFGRFSGMTTLQTDGEPGYDEATIYLRGPHSMRSNSFIILVDGFETDGFNQLTAEEIESVTYLKDAAALAVHGISGANGALLITTKRGSLTGKKLKISFKARYGVQTPTHLPRFENAYNYARLYNEGLENDGMAPLYSESDLAGYQSGTDPYAYPDVNWYDEMLSKTSDLQDYTLSFSGGNKFSRYYVMAGYMGSNGLYAHTDGKNNSNISFQRINFRANVDIDVSSNLSFALNLGGRIEDRKFPNTGTATLWQNMATYAPNLYPVRTPQGQITGTANYPDNPIGSLLEEGYGSRHSRNVQAIVTAKYLLPFITDGLAVFGGVALSSNYMSGYNKTKSYAYYEPVKTLSQVGEDSLYYIRRGTDTDLTVSTGNDGETSRTGVHAGVEYETRSDLHNLNLQMMFKQDAYSIFGQQSVFAKQNWLGRFGYAYDRKYLAELSFSYSGTDNYKKGQRFGLFPALSLGWILSNEDFIPKTDKVNFLKIRGSAGLLGNDNGAERFAYNQYWGTASRQGYNQGYFFGTGVTFQDALVQLALADPNFTWEKAMLYDVGIDALFFNRRLSLTADLYLENRYDILVNVANTMPSFSGVDFSSMQNKGKTRNQGFEVSARYADKVGDVNYFAGLGGSMSRTKIVASYETPRKEEARYTQGRPLGQRFGLEAIGFFRDETDIENNPLQTFSNVRPGDLKYKDQNGDGIIDVNDEVAIGNPNIPEISYSANVGVSWKGFDLEFLFDGNTNRSVYLSGYMFWPFINDYNISKWTTERRWTPETADRAAAPRLGVQANANNYRSSDFWVRDISLLRLRNAEIGWTYQGGALQRAKIEKCRVYLSALNLFTLDNLDADVDPETLSAGYPTLKTFSLGVTLDF